MAGGRSGEDRQAAEWLLEGFPSTADYNQNSWNYSIVVLALAFSVEQAQGHQEARQPAVRAQRWGSIFPKSGAVTIR